MVDNINDNVRITGRRSRPVDEPALNHETIYRCDIFLTVRRLSVSHCTALYCPASHNNKLTLIRNNYEYNPPHELFD